MFRKTSFLHGVFYSILPRPTFLWCEEHCSFVKQIPVSVYWLFESSK